MTKLSVFKIFLFFSIFIIPSLVSAGIFSSFLGKTTDIENEPFGREDNSQTVYLLQAAVNTNPSFAKGGGDITVIDESALLAETGISGSLVEVNERQNNDKISIYEVRQGDNLSQIADMFGVSVNTIRWANDLRGSIVPGQTLIILPINGVKHVVKSGGTVSDIAKIYNGDAREIAIFNGISIDTNLEPGDEILVPHGEIEEVPEKTNKTVAKVTTKSAVKSSNPTYSGYYMRPISGGVKTQGLHGYNAIDIGVPVGTPIYAAASGTVIINKSSGWNGGYGAYIVIKHDNGTQTLYAHNSRNDVVVGQRVNQGEVIGAVGNTGRSTGPHLHFEIRGATNPF